VESVFLFEIHHQKEERGKKAIKIASFFLPFKLGKSL
jgi:hypothetical protein